MNGAGRYIVECAGRPRWQVWLSTGSEAFLEAVFEDRLDAFEYTAERQQAIDDERAERGGGYAYDVALSICEGAL